MSRREYAAATTRRWASGLSGRRRLGLGLGLGLQAPALLAGLFLAMSGSAQAEAGLPLGPETRAAAIGLDFGYLSVPIGRADPFAYAASASLWCEWAPARTSRLRAGAWLGISGFRSMDPAFERSLMYSGGLEFGYSFPLALSADSRISLRPLARLGWYARRIEMLGAAEWASRPLLSAGCLFELSLEPLDLGFLVMLTVPAEREPVVLFGISQRVGLWL